VLAYLEHELRAHPTTQRLGRPRVGTSTGQVSERAAGGRGTAKNRAEIARILDPVEQYLKSLPARSRGDVGDWCAGEYPNWGFHRRCLIEKCITERYNGCLSVHRCDLGMAAALCLMTSSTPWAPNCLR